MVSPNPDRVSQFSRSSEGARLSARLRRAREERETLALALLVGCEGSSSRREGARALIDAEGRTTGLVSSGFAEPLLLEAAHEVLESGAPRLVDLPLPEPGAGKIQIFLERVDAASLTDHALERLARRNFGTTGEIVTTILSAPAGDADWLGTDKAHSARLTGLKPQISHCLHDEIPRRARVETTDGWIEAFLDFVPPLPQLTVVGAGEDTHALLALGEVLGWRLAVLDPGSVEPERMGPLIPEGDHSVVVVMTHDCDVDRRALPGILARRVAYVGLVGSRARAERLRRELEDGGAHVSDAWERMRHPVGLDLVGEGPEAIALAIVTEAQAVLGAIHSAAPVDVPPLAAGFSRLPGRERGSDLGIPF